jgi:hypothetical protein
VPTTDANRNGYSILLLTDDLDGLHITNCKFRNTYFYTIGRNSTGNVIQGPRDWLIDNCDLYNTMAHDYWGEQGAADFSDIYRTGFNDIAITNIPLSGLAIRVVEYSSITTLPSTKARTL